MGVHVCVFIAREILPSVRAGVFNMVELNFENDLQNALDQTLSSFPNVHSLKPEQKLVVEKVVSGRDVFAQLPTGFGKSLTFQVLPAVCKYLSLLGHKFPLNPVVMVVTPLVAIMEDQGIRNTRV